jgi:hypothetical protein
MVTYATDARFQRSDRRSSRRLLSNGTATVHAN